jgi:hypothetical protein
VSGSAIDYTLNRHGEEQVLGTHNDTGSLGQSLKKLDIGLQA